MRQGAAGSGSRLVPGEADMGRDAACLDLRLLGGPESGIGADCPSAKTNER